MENATKALIIAASVLIVIILIAISIKILFSTSDVPDQVDTVSSNLETNVFNSQFLSDIGNNVSGLKVKSLISKIIVSNSKNPEHQVALNGVFTSSELSTISSTIANNDSFQVLASTYDSNGFLTGITIPFGD